MKKLITMFIVCAGFAVPAVAQHHGHHGHWHHRGGHSPWVWVAPAIIGGVIGYEISRNQPPVVVQQPVIIQQQPGQVYGYSPNCSPWTEVQNSDGTVTRTRTCAQ
jgi:hypothetical protein